MKAERRHHMQETNQKPSARRLIAVSNRTSAGTSRAGGLAVALWEALESSQGLWVGWNGRITDYPNERFTPLEEDGVSFALCSYSKSEYDDFYLGYSNRVLWPVLHGRLDLAQFDPDQFETYAKINYRFADGILTQAQPGDLLWVHDYHFLLLGEALKAAGWTGPCGFFLHVPFPSPDAFRAIPDHIKLAKGLCAYDIIGLQSQRDVANLIMYLEQELDGEQIDAQTIRIGHRAITILHCPIGIDASGFGQISQSDTAQEAANKISVFLRNRDLVIGVDRMDYSKGLPQRFEGMARFYDQNPDLHGRVSYTQIAPPSRSVVDEYVQLRERLDALSGRINGDYGDLDWIPIRYLARGYDREEIAGLYRVARVGLVTPLQDGMNLVAKEFIAAQNPEDPGVLVLSQFAGAAEQMTDALIINPHDADAVSSAVKQALKMPLDERKRRWQKLYQGICKQDITWWRERFLTAFEAIAAARYTSE